MALPILDGNQTATTLSTILSSGAHIPAHTVVSLGAQAITDMRSAVSGSVVSISNLPSTQTIAGTVTANVPPSVDFIYSSINVYNTADPDDSYSINEYFTRVSNNRWMSGKIANNAFFYYNYNNGWELRLAYNDDFEDYDLIYTSSNRFSGFPPNSGWSLDSAWTQNQSLVVSNLQPQLYNGTITIGNSVTIGSLPAISGTVTANVANSVTIGSLPAISGTVTANVSGSVNIEKSQYQSGNEDENYKFVVVGASQNASAILRPLNVDSNQRLIVSTVTIGNSINIGSLPVQLSTTTIGGTSRLNVTLSSATTVGGTAPSYGNLSGGSDGTNFRAILTDISGRTVVTVSNFPATQPVSLASLPSLAAGTAQIGSVTASISGTVPVSGTFWQATQPVSGTVTATVASTTVTVSALPSGALTTRFGSVTTANTAQITSAVTNTSRKYLLAQNISAGTVTIGIGFSPTTTQGIQLTAGSGLTFDSFCPTGAVWWLGATTGSTWTILEG